jgi:ABC-2 type transport system permease protein
MEVVKAIYLKDASPAHAAQLAWPLLLIGAITLTSAALLFRKKTA